MASRLIVGHCLLINTSKLSEAEKILEAMDDKEQRTSFALFVNGHRGGHLMRNLPI